MQISVNIAARNAEPYLKEAIDSLLNQDFDDFECVVVDDGSTDRTAEILASYSDPRLRVIPLPVNCGMGVARNVALRSSQGKYIAVMDADDICLPNRLSTQHKFMDEHPDIHILGTRTIRIHQSIENEMDRPQHPLEDADIKALLLLMNGSALVHPTTMMRTDFLKAHDLMYAPRRMSVDHAFWIQSVAKGCRFHTLPDVLLYKRRHDSNVTLQRDTEDHAKIPLRMELLGMYFPELTASETRAIAMLMARERQLKADGLCAGIAAGKKAMLERRSFYGEARGLLNDFLRQIVAQSTGQFAKSIS